IIAMCSQEANSLLVRDDEQQWQRHHCKFRDHLGASRSKGFGPIILSDAGPGVARPGEKSAVSAYLVGCASQSWVVRLTQRRGALVTCGEGMMKRTLVLALALLVLGSVRASTDAGWPVYGGDDGGMRYSPASQITPKNVDDLIPIWTFHTGDIGKRDEKTMRRTKLEGTPILIGDKLLVCSPFNEVIALDPGTGEEKWRFDPKIPTDQVFPANKFTCRGVAAWSDTSQFNSTAMCSKRVIAATNDARVIALDLDTGKPCTGFGVEGEVKVQPSMQL